MLEPVEVANGRIVARVKEILEAAEAGENGGASL